MSGYCKCSVTLPHDAVVCLWCLILIILTYFLVLITRTARVNLENSSKRVLVCTFCNLLKWKTVSQRIVSQIALTTRIVINVLITYWRTILDSKFTLDMWSGIPSEEKGTKVPQNRFTITLMILRIITGHRYR